jgi:hypothetical protein
MANVFYEMSYRILYFLSLRECSGMSNLVMNFIKFIHNKQRYHLLYNYHHNRESKFIGILFLIKRTTLPKTFKGLLKAKIASFGPDNEMKN